MKVCKDCCKAFDLPGMLEGSDPKEALRGFAEVVRMEPEKGRVVRPGIALLLWSEYQIDARTQSWQRCIALCNFLRQVLEYLLGVTKADGVQGEY